MGNLPPVKVCIHLSSFSEPNDKLLTYTCMLYVSLCSVLILIFQALIDNTTNSMEDSSLLKIHIHFHFTRLKMSYLFKKIKIPQSLNCQVLGFKYTSTPVPHYDVGITFKDNSMIGGIPIH